MDRTTALKTLARQLHQMRPDWNEGGILVALHRDERSLPELETAAKQSAADPTARTPAVINHHTVTVTTTTVTTSHPQPGKPPWCGQCSNDRTRQTETPDGKIARCPNCHPLALNPHLWEQRMNDMRPQPWQRLRNQLGH